MIKPYRGLAPRIHPDAFVAETAVVIGDVEIGAGSSVWYGAVIRGDVNRIVIGRDTNVQDGTVIHCNHDRQGDYRQTGGGLPTLIGDGVTIGHLALLHACTLSDGCFVGMRATVMDGAVVERGAMVAAGALVTPGKRVPSGELWAGAPAAFKRRLTAEELASFPYQAGHYRQLGETHREA
ncbi:Carbonic anhydrase or acetyltransferase, isoleucine patch superfamily [Tistlia consotensis]|uniref:Carbonic anhydrase or acetyltransferase, isoleucine patch superfamily n=1 Tax=Tistlia consotensis USBA 355 TaxID=560819 RepID=A0A1Y6BNH0_9PROT|nr:gamma carbonic anhydrase family protein [Tistlia consotensis]SMF20626.1 Carbonic anhydrase or acetyltransferase, isoleucine patch superfamily [Tistlia consotensis USBA 355]SNR47728.1 Carbonic anhydrase or acetyltransferase, isoleucine patch superfamily [Tistlia consotensis]